MRGPTIGALPVQLIDTALLTKVLEQELRDAPDTHRSTLDGKGRDGEPAARRMESVLEWAKVRGYREGASLRSRSLGGPIARHGG
jgi:hypothetical protein